MRIPRSVYFSNRKYPVKTRKRPEKWVKRWDGEFSGEIIWLSKGRTRKEKESTFVHEILHLIAPYLREREILKLEPRLHEFLDNNSL